MPVPNTFTLYKTRFMAPRIVTIPPKKLVGKRLIMTFSNNRTQELWRSFMPIRNEIKSPIGIELFSIQIYPPTFFNNFDPNQEFEKWAAIEVTDNKVVTEAMEPFNLSGGLYAVFHFKGHSMEAESTFKYILGTWLPNSKFTLDYRPHFEVLGEKYKIGDPNSEEEIWIPIKLKD
jgi:AraC family transcriptional regulator